MCYNKFDFGGVYYIMNELIVRLLSIELNDFKNVDYGKIEMPNSNTEDGFKGNSEILGIYGQNGSGKTAVIDALGFLKILMMGLPLPSDTASFIGNLSDKSTCAFKFFLQDNSKQIIVNYLFTISRDTDVGIEIEQEKISYSLIENGKWSRETDLINYSPRNEDVLFTPKYRFKSIISADKENKVSLNVAKVVAKKEGKSFIFSDEARGILEDGAGIDNAAFILHSLRYYAITDLFVIKNSHSGIIKLDFAIPFSVKHEKSGNFSIEDLVVSLCEPTIFDSDTFGIFKSIVEEMNLVLKSLVPGLTIFIKEHGPQVTRAGENGVRFELLSVRGDVRIPLKYESEGIKKMLSILNILIAMYNNPSICMAVDELDAGIFEYLLGELLGVIEESGKGQLIFTSHNLRPLEMIRKSSLVFTTTNPQNRYIRLTNVKSNNNLRDLYLRSINIGDQKEQVYAPTKEYDIRRAFRKAGRDLNG